MVKRRRRGAHRSSGLLALVGTLAFVGQARAQALLERFDPAERGSRFFVADSLELDGKVRFATGVVTSYGTRLRTFRQSGGDLERSELVARSIWVHPGASLVLTPGARFSVDVPVALQSGSDVSLDRKPYGAPGSPRMGDVRASFDLRLAGPDRRDVDGVVLAAGVVGWVPTGSASDYTSDDFARVGIRLATSVRAGPIIGAARVGYAYRKDDLEPIGGVRLGSEANGVIALGVRGGPVVVGPELHGVTILGDAFQRRSTPVEVLLGGHLTVDDVQFGMGAGGAVVTGLGAPLFRGVVSLEWTPSASAPSDRDRDGILDSDDMCPDVPGLAVAPLGAVGCPAAPRDTDRDGIIDADDACPDLAGLGTRDGMTNGCPDGDHDSVPDPLDACPAVPGVRSVLPRFNGCPPDADGDGIGDARDACPAQPGVASEEPAANGCPPPPPDADGDGIADDIDACPDVAGPATPRAQVSGCPAERPEGSVTYELVFEPDVTRLMKESDALIVRLAAGLLAHPDVRLVVVVAPGAARGKARRTRADPKHARAHAKVVVDRLRELGVAKERFDARRAKGPAASKQLELRVVGSVAR